MDARDPLNREEAYLDDPFSYISRRRSVGVVATAILFSLHGDRRVATFPGSTKEGRLNPAAHCSIETGSSPRASHFI
jgi:hypothetical protein